MSDDNVRRLPVKGQGSVTAEKPVDEQVRGLANGRPPLKLVSTAESMKWLRNNIGAGRLAGMFRRGEEIVHCPVIGQRGYEPLTGRDRDDDGPAQVRPLDGPKIASFIQLEYCCYKIEKDKSGAEYPVEVVFRPDAARLAVHFAERQPKLRSLRGVTHSPMPRADGTILDKPGYDPQTKLLYLPAPSLTVAPVPERPTAGQVAEALKLLRYMVKDFTFVTDHDEANYLGGLLTPLLREITPPPYKQQVINAPQPGSGKSLLALVQRLIHGGVFRCEVPDTAAEMKKEITTILDTTTGPVVQFDNVSGVLRSSVVSGLLTSATWESRVLGVNRQMKARNDRLWVFTGNNVNLGGDLVRRSFWVTIDPRCPDPHLRSDFTISALDRWVLDHRGELLHALLVLIRHWHLEGRPTVARGADTYQAWTEAVAGILATADHPGVFDHPDSVRQTTGEDDTEWREFLVAVHAKFGDKTWTAGQLVELFEVERVPDALGGWHTKPGELPQEVLPTDLATKAAKSGARAITKSLGRWLRNRDGRWSGGYTVRRCGDEPHANAALWAIETKDQAS